MLLVASRASDEASRKVDRGRGEKVEKVEQSVCNRHQTAFSDPDSDSAVELLRNNKFDPVKALEITTAEPDSDKQGEEKE